MVTFTTLAELVAFCKKWDKELYRVRFEMADGEPVVAFHVEEKPDGTISVIVSDRENQAEDDGSEPEACRDCDFIPSPEQPWRVNDVGEKFCPLCGSFDLANVK